MSPSTSLKCLGFAIVLRPASSNSILRNDPRLPILGTKNFELLDGPKFTPRHSHATCVFKCPDNPADSCIWLTGGYSESHRTFDVVIMENENPDVWYSRDGASWTQVTELYGDFLQGVGNGDAKVGGYVAPWYSRYAHSLNALDADGDGVADVMVLAGGNAPIPSNDVWISRDGTTWRFDGYAPWPKRAYHGANVFQDKLWILGGTPLSNDVWAGSLVEDSSRGVGYRLVWEQVLAPNEAPWRPRAGFCTLSQLRRNSDSNESSVNSTDTNSFEEYMFVLGGLVRGEDDPLVSDDGTRARNDVWRTTDGKRWEEVLPPTETGKTRMPWPPRAFHSCVTLEDRSLWVGADEEKEQLKGNLGPMGNNTDPRMFLTGGGYMGRFANNDVRELEAYTDTWWSYDGADWVRVNYEEGSKESDNLYSTNEWTEHNDGGRKIYRGKWGHSLEAFYVSKNPEEDVVSKQNSDCLVSSNVSACEIAEPSDKRVPSLIVIGGKLESGPMVSDVFASLPGVHCEVDGVTCGLQGHCGPENQGCICRSSLAGDAGNYCGARESNIHQDRTA